LRSPFLMPGLLLGFSFSLFFSPFNSPLTPENEPVNRLVYCHSTNRSGCVHGTVYGSTPAEEKLHRLYVVTVVVIPEPGIESGNHLIRNAVRNRHGETVFLGHLDGRFLIVRRGRKHRRFE